MIEQNASGPFFKPLFMAFDYGVRNNNELSGYSTLFFDDKLDKTDSGLREGLIKMSKHNNANYRLFTVMYLSAFNDSECYDQIIKLAEKDPDINVRIQAVNALGHNDDTRAVKFLAMVPLKSKVVSERRAGVFTLNAALKPGSLTSANEYKKIEQQLIEALRDEDVFVRNNALIILKRFAGMTVLKDIKPLLKDPYPVIRRSAREAIVEIEKRSNTPPVPASLPSPRP